MVIWNSNQWNYELLVAQPAKHLQVMCLLLNCPKSGNKAQVVQRMLDYRRVRMAVAHYEEADTLAQAYKKKQLRDMCAQVGQWKSGNKRGLATALLNWRNECRSKGQALLAEARATVAMQQQEKEG